jgi:hypothetical protein
MNLSRKTEKIVKSMYGRDEANEVERLLIDHCSNNVPGCRDWSEENLERIWLSVLKVSNGNIRELQRAIALANTDYRDLFVSRFRL